MSGSVVLVGAGPGDPDLLTVRALRELENAEVLLYDALIDPILLEFVATDCERIDVGKRGDGTKGVSQSEIAELMLAKAKAGKRVVRLKGGDPTVFGRGGEEASLLADAGIPFEFVPGISSSIAVPTFAGIPVTDRRLSSSFAVITGHRGKSPEDLNVDWEGIARSAETLVVLMGTAWLENLVERVIQGGKAPDTPAAVISHGTRPEQACVVAPLSKLPAAVKAAGLRSPTITIVGEVVRFRERLKWFELRPLFGQRVLVARARGQTRDLAHRLYRVGARPVCVPLIEFQASGDPSEIERAARQIGEYDWVAFTSATAVRFTGEYVVRSQRGNISAACVGESTAAFAREEGWDVRVTPRKSLPEELVKSLTAVRDLHDARVLFPRAAGAREALVRGLTASGARVDDVEVYRTVAPASAANDLKPAVDQGLDAIMLTSPSIVENLLGCLGQEATRELQRSATWVCIGPTTAAKVEELGFTPDIVCDNASGEAMVASLCDWKREPGHGIS